jgi:hypothetical protein
MSLSWLEGEVTFGQRPQPSLADAAAIAACLAAIALIHHHGASARAASRPVAATSAHHAPVAHGHPARAS